MNKLTPSTTRTNTTTSKARFQSRYDLRGLVDVVAAVARLADKARPEQVTQKQWDAARAQAGYADAPQARQVATRLKLPWPDVLALALSGADVDRTLGRRFGEDEDPYLDTGDVRAALRAVALRLNKKTLLRPEYVAERERIMKAARGHWRHGSGIYLPTIHQAERIAGSWEAALALAGLNPQPPQARPGGLSISDVLELALEAHGCLLTKPECVRFASANKLSIAKRSWRAPWRDHLIELRTRRADWGKWTPPCPPSRDVRPDYRVPVDLPPDVPKDKKKRRWSKEECVLAIALMLDELPPKTRLTQHLYQELATGRREIPNLASIQRHGKFSDMVRAARKKRTAFV